MKKLLGYLNLLFLAGAMIFITSCGGDDPITDPTGPTITASETSTITAQPQGAGTTISFKVSGVKGASALNAIKITEEGSPLDISRFTFNGSEQSSSTFVLATGLKDGFSDMVVTIDLPATSGTYTYALQLTDENNKADNVSIAINVEGLTTITSDTLYNYQGPLAGGLEFATGKHIKKGTEFPSDPEKGWSGAHIRDDGNNVVGNTYPWKGTIKAWETTQLRTPSSTVDFDKVLNNTEIQDIYNNGSSIATLKLSVGQVFTALRDGNYYLVKVIEVKDDGKDSGTNFNLDYSRYLIKHK